MEKYISSADLFVADNPIINPPPLPHGVEAFDRIEPEHIIPALKWAIAKVNENLRAIEECPDPPSFENTCEALENHCIDFYRVSLIQDLFRNTMNSEALSEAIKDIFDYRKQSVSSIIFERIKSVFERKDSLNLDEEQSRLLNAQYRALHAMYESDDPETYEQLLENSSRGNRIVPAFIKNIICGQQRFCAMENLSLSSDRALREKYYKCARTICCGGDLNKARGTQIKKAHGKEWKNGGDGRSLFALCPFLAGRFYLSNGLYLIRCGWVASGPRRRRRSAS